MSRRVYYFVFFHDPATTDIYTYFHTLSLPDALPIYDFRNAIRASRSSLLISTTFCFAASASPPCHRTASNRDRARPSWRNRVWPLTVRVRPMPHSGGVRHSCPVASPSGFPSASPSPMSCSKRSRSEEHTSELQSLMRISYAVFCLKKQTINSH